LFGEIKGKSKNRPSLFSGCKLCVEGRKTCYAFSEDTRFFLTNEGSAKLHKREAGICSLIVFAEIIRGIAEVS